MFPGLPGSTAFTSCVGGDDTHVFLSPGVYSSWSGMFSKQSSLFAFLSSFSYLLSYILSESHRTDYLKRFCKTFFRYLFSSGFDRMRSETIFPVLV